MRIDQLVSQKFNLSRTKAQQLIESNQVEVNGVLCTKTSSEVKENDNINIIAMFQFASLGGDKLYKAFVDFNFYPQNMVCVDIGASNGGFTDCMLQYGATKVFAVDVGACALDKKIACDNRVVVIDNFNARNLEKDTLGEMCDFVSIDVSFISLKLVLANACNVLKNGGKIIALIKPQFEVGAKFLTKKGIVNSPKEVEKAIQSIKDYAISLGMEVLGLTNAPIKANKNKEYLLFLKKSSDL